ncbi:MAG: ferritin-like protein [Bacteroidia bacterium]|nr:ferritin-like protein [Bacteroidia bacterium]
MKSTHPKNKTGHMITTVESLHAHLQIAIELELSTLPPYLSAMYSIKEGYNQQAYEVIRSVVMEEMLHLTLAASVLNAVGGNPLIDRPRLVPTYPTALPWSNNSYIVHLLKFSRPAIETFMRIELPAKPTAPPQPMNYNTIGQFYEAIADGIKYLYEKLGDKLFSGKDYRQIDPSSYYGGGGKVIPILGSGKEKYELSLKAIDEIVSEGEGLVIDGKLHVYDGDSMGFEHRPEIAHYFKFREIFEGRYYRDGDSPHKPTGKILPVDWTEAAVYNMGPNPKIADYLHFPELWDLANQFNTSYADLLKTIHYAFNHDPKGHGMEAMPPAEVLKHAVGKMYKLKYQAVALMRIPMPGKDYNAGPTFELG